MAISYEDAIRLARDDVDTTKVTTFTGERITYLDESGRLMRYYQCIDIEKLAYIISEYIHCDSVCTGSYDGVEIVYRKYGIDCKIPIKDFNQDEEHIAYQVVVDYMRYLEGIFFNFKNSEKNKKET